MSVQSFDGAVVILPDDSVETRVTIADGTIAEIGGPPQGTVIDARGKILAPALIDVHGDAFERQVMPRPGVFFPMETALLETDRQLAANGIATTYHSITLSYEPGLRSVARGREMMEALRSLAPRLLVENRVQLRWETFATEALDTIEWAMEAPLQPSLAFNDHLSMSMRRLDMPLQDRLFEHNPDFAVADTNDARFVDMRMAKNAGRAGMSLQDYTRLTLNVWKRRADVPARIKALAAHARQKGIPMLSHDDTQVETRTFYRDIGATNAEFPMTMAPARDAQAAGDTIIFGAPNVVRGGSHIGSLAAADMIEDGLCDVLASDYYYPALLAAAHRLEQDRRADRNRIWSLMSEGPARAMGLDDRGRIAPGLRADLVLVDWPDGATPAILGTWVAGRAAYRSFPTGA